MSETDECLYLGDYTAGEGYAHSETNQLITNLKIAPDKQGTARWKYKLSAIDTVGKAFAQAVPSAWLSGAAFVPVPPSVCPSDDGYDDRMVRVLGVMKAAGAKDIRELIVQSKTVEPSHTAQRRHRPEDLIPLYSVVEKLAKPAPSLVVVTDDVLTTGSHFKAMQSVIVAKYPKTRVVGLFAARRVPKGMSESFKKLIQQIMGN